MKTIEKIVTGILVIGLVVIGVLYFSKGDNQVSVGATPGSDFYDSVFLRGGATVGSGCFATSTTGTLTAQNLGKNSCIRIAATGAGQGVISLTLPASTTLPSLFPDVGGCRSWIVDNSDVAAATTTTIVKGTGIDLVGLDATGAGTGADVIDGLEFGRLELCRQTDNDYVGFVQEYIAAD